MSLSAAAIDALIASGVTAEQLGAAVKAELSASEAERAAKRAKWAAAKRAQRGMSSNVRETPQDSGGHAETIADPLPRKERSPTPPKETQPTPTPSKPSGLETPQRKSRRSAKAQLTATGLLAWAAFPASGRERSSRSDVAEAWPDAAVAAGGEERLLAAIQRFARDGRDLKEAGAKGMHRWLNDGRFDFWLGGENGAAEPIRISYDGPPELRAEIASTCGEAFAASYVDAAHWQESPPTIVARTGFAAEKLKREAGPILRRRNVAVQQGAQA